MRRWHGGWASILSLAALSGCGGAPPIAEAPPPSAPPIAAESPPIAAVAAPPVDDTPAPEPTDMMMWLRVTSPVNTLPALQGVVQARGTFALMLEHPERVAELALGRALASILDFNQPLDLAVTLPQGVKDYRFAFAASVREGEGDANALRKHLRVAQLADGRLGVAPLSPDDGGKLDDIACEVAPVPGRGAHRLVCAVNAETLASYEPFLVRTASRETSTAALRLHFPGEAYRTLARTAVKPVTGSSSERAGERFGQELAITYLEDVESMNAELTPGSGSAELVIEQIFRSARSVATLAARARPGAPQPLPEAFFRMPADADVALFFQGAPPEAMKPAGARFFQAFGAAMPESEVPAPVRDAIVASCSSLLLTGGPLVVAHGHDRLAAEKAVDAFMNKPAPKPKPTPKGPGTADKPDPALLAARASLQGWSLLYVDEPAPAWRAGLLDFTRAVAPSSAKKPPRGSGRKNTTMRELPIKPAEGLPAGSLHVIISARPVPGWVPPPGSHRAPVLAHDIHLFMAPGAKGTWLSIAEDEARARDRLKQVLPDAHPAVLANRSDLVELRAVSGSGAGFVSLAGLVSMFLPDESGEEVTRAGDMLARASSLPGRGMTAIPVVLTSAPQGEGAGALVRTKATAVLSHAAVQDLVRWIEMSP